VAQLRLQDPESTGLGGTVGYMGPYPLKTTKNRRLTFTGAYRRRSLLGMHVQV